jgi:hypothetical protein
MLYATVIRRSLKYLRFARVRKDDMLPLATALVSSSIYLVCITPLDNYFEVARVTIPLWTLFWVVTQMYHQRKQENLMALYASQYGPGYEQPQPAGVPQLVNSR